MFLVPGETFSLSRPTGERLGGALSELTGERGNIESGWLKSLSGTGFPGFWFPGFLGRRGLGYWPGTVAPQLTRGEGYERVGGMGIPKGATSWGGRRITERDLRDVARQVSQGVVKRRETEDVAYVTRFRWSGPANGRGSRVATESSFVCTAKIRILEERGYVVLGKDGVWSLTLEGDVWLAGFAGHSGPVEIRMKEE